MSARRDSMRTQPGVGATTAPVSATPATHPEGAPGESQSLQLDALMGFEREAIRSIRRALVIGLQSICEIERIGRECTPDVPKAVHPVHPTGTDDVQARFADALRWVECLEGGAG